MEYLNTGVKCLNRKLQQLMSMYGDGFAQQVPSFLSSKKEPVLSGICIDDGELRLCPPDAATECWLAVQCRTLRMQLLMGLDHDLGRQILLTPLQCHFSWGSGSTHPQGWTQNGASS